MASSMHFLFDAGAISLMSARNELDKPALFMTVRGEIA
jgi:hypothetical protein